MSEKAMVLLGHHLKELRLSTFLRGSTASWSASAQRKVSTIPGTCSDSMSSSWQTAIIAWWTGG